MKTPFESLAAMLLLLFSFCNPAAGQESDKPAIPLPAEPPFGDVAAEFERAEIFPKHGLPICTPRVYLAGERIYFMDDSARFFSLPSRDVASIRAAAGSHWLEGAAIGGGIGLGSTLLLTAGALVGDMVVNGITMVVTFGLARGDSHRAAAPSGCILPATLIGLVLGGAIGAAVPKFDDILIDGGAAAAQMEFGEPWNSGAPAGNRLFAMRIRL